MTHCCRGYYDILILSTKDISKKFKFKGDNYYGI